jgi:hypothetical protein
MKKVLFISLLIILFASQSQAQQDILTDTIEWTAIPYVDLSQDTAYQTPGKFVTYGKSKIMWTQIGKANPKSKPQMRHHLLTVSSTKGEWTNVEVDGQIIFNIRLKGNEGTALFRRSGTEMFIQIKWIDKEDHINSFNFNVAHHRTINTKSE